MKTVARVTCKGKEFELTAWQLHMFERFKEQAEEKADNETAFDVEAAEYGYLQGLFGNQPAESDQPISIVENYFKKNGMKKYTCCICGCEFYDFTGCNPDPVVNDEDAVCCHSCDNLFVFPARRMDKEDFEKYMQVTAE